MVVLTRTAAGNKIWAAYFSTLGISTYDLPAIRTSPVRVTPQLEDIFSALSGYDWVVFTSAAGVHYAGRLLARLGILDADLPPIAVIGAMTGAAVRDRGWPVAFEPSRAQMSALAEEIPLRPDAHILLLRADIGSRALPSILMRRGAQVTDAAIYHTRHAAKDVQFSHLLASGHVRGMVFASPSAVRGTLAYLTTEEALAVCLLPAIAIGPRTAAELERSGFGHVLVAREPSMEAIGTILLDLFPML